ncbi:MAG TPA: glycoside hydrolase family 130 protein, partial [Armatimonadota bacterium]
MRAERNPHNPLITPLDVPPTRPDLEVVCVFNAGAVKYGDETILLLRVAERAVSESMCVRVPVLKCDHAGGSCIDIIEFHKTDSTCDFHDPRAVFTPGGIFLTSISHLRVARSRDGINFTIDPLPAIFPDRPSETFGLEDPRITEIDGLYYIAYKSVSPTGICTSLAVTKDFVHFDKKGIIFCPENLDVCIFPEKIGGRYAALHRPVPHFLGTLNMWLAYSDDLIGWGDHRFLMGVQPDSWESGRIGGGAVPIKTERGWLEIYHGATPDDHYCLGAVLLDLDDPQKILARGIMPILVPEESYETEGFVPNVVFTAGAVPD